MNVSCPQCGLLIDSQGLQSFACPRCSMMMQTEQPIVTTRSYSRPVRKSSSAGLVVSILAAVVAAGFFVLACAGVFSGGPRGVASTYGTAGDSSTIYDAKLYGREAVRMNLKWPDDAEFLGYEEVSGVKGKPRYFQVTGKVKAANGFGAKLTHTFIAEVRIHDVKSREWRYHYVQLGDQVLYSNPWEPK